jgi:hypothetical protein
MATAPPPARQRLDPRGWAAALPASYTIAWDTTPRVSWCVVEVGERLVEEERLADYGVGGLSAPPSHRR